MDNTGYRMRCVCVVDVAFSIGLIRLNKVVQIIVRVVILEYPLASVDDLFEGHYLQPGNHTT